MNILFSIFLISNFFGSITSKIDNIKKDNNNNNKNSTIYIEVCYLHLRDIDVRNFFAGVDKSIFENQYSFISKNELPKYIQSTGECNIFDNITKIRIIFSYDSMDQLHELIDLFNIVEWKYLDNFYILFQGNTVNVKKFWGFFSDVFGDPDKYLKYKNLTSYELSTNFSKIFGPQYAMFSWGELIGHVMSMFVESYDIKSPSHVIYGVENMPMNWLIRINSKIVEMRNSKYVHPSLLNYDRNAPRPYTIFEHSSKKFAEWMGIYDYDEQGRRRLNFIQDVFTPLLNQAVHNETFFSDIYSEISDNLELMSKNHLKLTTLIYDVFNRISSTKEWPKIKDSFYNIFYGAHLKNRWTKTKTFFSHPKISGFKYEYYGKLQRRLTDSHLLFKTLDYVYGHRHENYKMNSNGINHLRFQNPRHYFKHPDFGRDILGERYDETKYYNIPLIGSGITTIIHPGDIFDFDFWSTRNSWFSGFAPDDNKMLRPIGFFIIPLIMPSDLFSMVEWGWAWVTRWNLTRTIFPFVVNRYPDADETICLPAFPYLPRPFEYGCRFPQIEPMPPLYPPEKISEAFSLSLCVPWRSPFRQIEAIPQLILTPLIGPLFESNPGLKWLNDFVASIPVIGIRLVNNATGLRGTDALPFGLWQCMLFKLPLLGLLGLIALIILWVAIVSTYNNFMIINNSNQSSSTVQDLEALKQDFMYNHSNLQLTMAVVYNQIKRGNFGGVGKAFSGVGKGYRRRRQNRWNK